MNDDYMKLVKEMSKEYITEVDKKQRKAYWKDKWISVLAVALSAVALIKSFFF